MPKVKLLQNSSFRMNFRVRPHKNFTSGAISFKLACKCKKWRFRGFNIMAKGYRASKTSYLRREVGLFGYKRASVLFQSNFAIICRSNVHAIELAVATPRPPSAQRKCMRPKFVLPLYLCGSWIIAIEVIRRKAPGRRVSSGMK